MRNHPFLELKNEPIFDLSLVVLPLHQALTTKFLFFYFSRKGYYPCSMPLGGHIHGQAFLHSLHRWDPLSTFQPSYTSLFIKITIRTVNYEHIWYHFLNSGVTHYCAAPTVQVCMVSSPRNLKNTWPQIGIIHDVRAKEPPQPITAIIGKYIRLQIPPHK